jgi:MFS family permease
MKARKWAMEYGVAIGFTVIVSAILGQIPLFRASSIGKLPASDLVQFLGYGAALAIAWMSARRLAHDLPEERKWLTPFRALIQPMATLMAMAFAYNVLLLACGPFLGKTARGVYNWVFIVGIVGSAAWLVFNWITKCAPLMESADGRKWRKAA